MLHPIELKSVSCEQCLLVEDIPDSHLMPEHLPILSRSLHLTAPVKENVDDSAHTLISLVNLLLFGLE